VIAEGKARLLLLGTPEQFRNLAPFGDTAQPGSSVPEGMVMVPISCQSEGALEVYIEPVLPAPHLVIVGRSPMAHTLADLARALNWRAVLIDGPDFTSADAGEHSMVVVATQGHDDEEAVGQAVTARPAYLGLVGSHRRGTALLGYLAERGVPQDQLDRVRVPAGLDLGRTTHQEIAVAILAELVQLRASGAIASAPPGASRQDSPGAHPPAAQATDPVCGMTVAADESGYPLEFDGATYYFCRAACRGAFQSDPAAYVKKESSKC
jgi:xanthine dehydrogenase accessory factor